MSLFLFTKRKCLILSHQNFLLALMRWREKWFWCFYNQQFSPPLHRIEQECWLLLNNQLQRDNNIKAKSEVLMASVCTCLLQCTYIWHDLVETTFTDSHLNIYDVWSQPSLFFLIPACVTGCNVFNELRLCTDILKLFINSESLQKSLAVDGKVIFTWTEINSCCARWGISGVWKTTPSRSNATMRV